MPSLLILVEGELYGYVNGLHFFENAIQYLNRLANPIVPLKTAEDLKLFLDPKHQPDHDTGVNDFF